MHRWANGQYLSLILLVCTLGCFSSLEWSWWPKWKISRGLQPSCPQNLLLVVAHCSSPSHLTSPLQHLTKKDSYRKNKHKKELPWVKMDSDTPWRIEFIPAHRMVMYTTSPWRVKKQQSQQNENVTKSNSNRSQKPTAPGTREQIGGIWRGRPRVLPGELSHLTILQTQTKALNQHARNTDEGPGSIPDLPLYSRTHKLGETAIPDGWVGVEKRRTALCSCVTERHQQEGRSWVY